MKTKRVRQLKYKYITKCLKGGMTGSRQEIVTFHIPNANLASWLRITPAPSNLYHFITVKIASAPVVYKLNCTNLAEATEQHEICQHIYIFPWTLLKLLSVQADLFLSHHLRVYPRILFLHLRVQELMHLTLKESKQF